MKFFTDSNTAAKWINVVLSTSQLGVVKFGRPLVLANYSSAEPTLLTIADVENALTDVENVVADLIGHPGEYMRVLCRAQRAVLSILKSEKRPYLSLVRDILDLDFMPIPDSEAAVLRAQLDNGLEVMGYRGSLDKKVECWLAQTSITGEPVIELAKQIVNSSREATIRQVVALPPSEGLDSIYSVRNVHYSGRSQYTGEYRGWLHFNVDKIWQEDVFVQVLCHEGYPGHQTFYCLWDVLFRDGSWPLEAAYYQLNNSTNVVFEGGPEVAMTFIGWDQGDNPVAHARRVGQVFKDLNRVGMNNACYYSNLGEMKRAEAVAYMMDHMTVRDDAERAFEFMTDTLACTNYPQYYYGRRMVGKAYALMSASIDLKKSFFDILYRTPHCTSTFLKAVSSATASSFDPFKFDFVPGLLDA